MSVQYCPTGEMIGDFFTKPLQGSLFKMMRSVIMNFDDATLVVSNKRSRECVEPVRNVINSNRRTKSSESGEGMTPVTRRYKSDGNDYDWHNKTISHTEQVRSTIS